MFTTMVKKRPTFDFWKYEGTEVLPGKVAKRLNDCGYTFSIVTHQLNYEDTATKVERLLKIFDRSDHEPLHTLHEGMYLVFSAHPSGWGNEQLEVMHYNQIPKEYEEAPLSIG